MEYTVKEVSTMTGVTIKTLHYYHKIGLLLPCKVTEAGYRLYGKSELERLQQILFYRELDFSLIDIKQAIESESDRVLCLSRQQKLLYAQKQRIDCLLDTIVKSIHSAAKGENMDTRELFDGFDKQGWEKALKPQNDYLKDKYNFDLMKNQDLDPTELNEKAIEAKQFMDSMKVFLINKQSPNDKEVHKTVAEHLNFLNHHGTSMDLNAYLFSVQFLVQDDFHRNMMENHQIGLSYYLLAVAENYATSSTS